MLYYLPNARSPEQRAEMVRLESEGVCIFCPQHYGREGGKVILHANDTWSVAANDYPYSGTKHHLLLLPHDHVTSMAELSPAARDGFWEILDRVRDDFGLDYFGLGSRNGDPRFTGATIMHLHVHIIVADPDYLGAAIALYLSSNPQLNAAPPSV